jgi:hypothetical protein
MELPQINIDKLLYNSYNNIIDQDYKIITISNYESNNNKKSKVDLSSYFPIVQSQNVFGITSSCAITSIMSYYNKKKGFDKLFSPYYLACLQYNITNNWHILDLYTGLQISLNTGLCSHILFNDNLNLSKTSESLVINDASNNKFKKISKLNLNINNLINLLNDDVPILCSIKILPNYNSNKFYDNFLNDEYWVECNNYYNNYKINDVLSVSIVIVGYDDNEKIFKFRGCWGSNVGDNGYFYMNYHTVQFFPNLFFDMFVIDDFIPILLKTKSVDGLTEHKKYIKLEDIELNDNEYIIELDKLNTPTEKQTGTISRIKSNSLLNDLTIEIDMFNSVDDLLYDFNDKLLNNQVCIYF